MLNLKEKCNGQQREKIIDQKNQFCQSLKKLCTEVREHAQMISRFRVGRGS
jgi:hypothetical protein